MVQTNFLAFLTLWKSERYEQAQKYIVLCRKFINDIIEERDDATTQNEEGGGIEGQTI
jgi:hypothetical protein